MQTRDIEPRCGISGTGYGSISTVSYAGPNPIPFVTNIVKGVSALEIRYSQTLWLLNHHYDLREHLKNVYPRLVGMVEVRVRAQRGQTSQVEAYGIERARLSAGLHALDRCVAILPNEEKRRYRAIILHLFYRLRQPQEVVKRLGMKRSTFWEHREKAILTLAELLNGDPAVNWEEFFKEVGRIWEQKFGRIIKHEPRDG